MSPPVQRMLFDCKKDEAWKCLNDGMCVYEAQVERYICQKKVLIITLLGLYHGLWSRPKAGLKTLKSVLKSLKGCAVSSEVN